MYELHETADLTAPVLVVAFESWVGAGSVGITAARHIAGEGLVIASFPPDLLYDYRVSRPKASFVEGALQELAWPSVTVRHRLVDGRDLLVLSGPEPNWHWQEFSTAVADLAAALGVVEQISLGGIPWAAPHTRPTVVVTTASQPDLMGDDANTPKGKVQVPAAIALAIESSPQSPWPSRATSPLRASRLSVSGPESLITSAAPITPGWSPWWNGWPATPG